MTRRITVGGIIFNVEPLGYELLKAYLDAWKQLGPGKKKLWEEQAAEHLLQQLTGGKSVTTLDHVEELCKTLPEIPFVIPKSRVHKTRTGGYLLKVAFGLW